MRYICYACKKEVKFEQIRKRMRCPYCGCRIIVKLRPKMIKRVKAI